MMPCTTCTIVLAGASPTLNNPKDPGEQGEAMYIHTGSSRKRLNQVALMDDEMLAGHRGCRLPTRAQRRIFPICATQSVRKVESGETSAQFHTLTKSGDLSARDGTRPPNRSCTESPISEISMGTSLAPSPVPDISDQFHIHESSHAPLGYPETTLPQLSDAPMNMRADVRSTGNGALIANDNQDGDHCGEYANDLPLLGAYVSKSGKYVQNVHNPLLVPMCEGPYGEAECSSGTQSAQCCEGVQQQRQSKDSVHGSTRRGLSSSLDVGICQTKMDISEHRPSMYQHPDIRMDEENARGLPRGRPREHISGGLMNMSPSHRPSDSVPLEYNPSPGKKAVSYWGAVLVRSKRREMSPSPNSMDVGGVVRNMKMQEDLKVPSRMQPQVSQRLEHALLDTQAWSNYSAIDNKLERMRNLSRMCNQEAGRVPLTQPQLSSKFQLKYHKHISDAGML